MRIKFSIPGQLKGKGRHRTRVVQLPGRRPFAQTYTPKETRSAEAMVKHFAMEVMAGKPPFAGPLAMTVKIFKPHPQSWSGKKKASTFFITTRPDWDNCGKLVSDSLNKIVWGDDAQIAFASIGRYYWNGPEQTDVEITDELVYPADLGAPVVASEPPPLFRHLGRRRVAA